MRSTTISTDGAVVIPSDLLARYGLGPGDQVLFVDYGGRLGVIPAQEDPSQAPPVPWNGHERLMTDVLLEERARDVERE